MERRPHETQLTAAPTWRRDARALWRRSGARFVVLAPEHDEALVLEGTAALTWELLAETIEEGELFSLLGEHFGVTVNQVAEELAPFLEDLLGYGAVCRP